MVRHIYTVILFLLPFYFLSGQNQQTEIFFQVTGLITDEEARPLSNVGVVSFGLRRGALSERTGIYSITSIPGDTIFFRALGFKNRYIVLPSDFDGRMFALDVVLQTDTIPIESVVIMPWKTYSEFIREMSKISPVSPEIENMNRNLESVAEAVANSRNITITPEAGYRYAMQQNFNMTATRSQYPVNNLLNPFAWAKFISGIKEGMLKNQETVKPPKKVKTNRKKKVK